MIPLDAGDIVALEGAFPWMRALRPRPAGVASLRHPSTGALHFVARATSAADLLPHGCPVLVPPDVSLPSHLKRVEVPDPRREFARLTRVLRETRRCNDVRLTSTGAFISDSARIGQGCHVEPGAYVGPGAEIGDRCVIETGAVIRGGVTVGSDS